MSIKMKIARDEIRADAEKQWNGSAELQAEFNHDFDRYLAYRAADASGQVKILRDQVNA